MTSFVKALKLIDANVYCVENVTSSFINTKVMQVVIRSN